MPKIDREHIGVAFDMQGCPNRCRHCWLGSASNQKLSEQDVRWGVAQFRDFIHLNTIPINKLSVATWFREPDFSDDYRKLYDLETELGDEKPSRYELLSVWRLAQDKTYADWAKSVGPDTCQISFFGMKETNDWFHRRKGVFDDALVATERLLAVGMKPRWQVFLTTKLLPELDDLLGLVGQLGLPDRVKKLGGEFQIFIHPPGPDYEARGIEELRPTVNLLTDLPKSILVSTRKHFAKEVLWYTEANLHTKLLAGDDMNNCDNNLPNVLWFLITANWDVFSNAGTLEPWWRLGNLKQDSVPSIIDKFENDKILGLQILFRKSAKELAGQYGNPEGQKVYSSKGDLLSLYRGVHCEKVWREGDNKALELTGGI